MSDIPVSKGFDEADNIQDPKELVCFPAVIARCVAIGVNPNCSFMQTNLPGVVTVW